MEACLFCGRSEAMRIRPATDLPLIRYPCCHLVALELGDRVEYARRVEREFFEDGVPERDWLEQRFAFHQARRRIREIARHRPSGRLLEIGVGSGELLHVARAEGFECQGVEPSPTLALGAAQRYGVKILIGYLEDLVAEDRFDVSVLLLTRDLGTGSERGRV